MKFLSWLYFRVCELVLLRDEQFDQSGVETRSRGSRSSSSEERRGRVYTHTPPPFSLWKYVQIARKLVSKIFGLMVKRKKISGSAEELENG